MDSYFDDTSMLRRVHREYAVALSGPRALLMQAAHPVAFEGLLAHTGARDEPYERLARTAAVMNTVAFGSRADADRATRRVRAMHRRVRGELKRPAGRFPAGTPFAADDPELLLWVLASIVDSALVFYDCYVGSLSHAEREAYWQDYRVVGRLFGLKDDEMPAGIDEFDDYMREMLTGGDLFVTSAARELAVQIVMRPPVGLAKRPVLELVNFITVGLLPPGLRRQFGLSWDPLRALMLRGGAEYAKRVLVPLAPERLRLVSRARPGRPPTPARPSRRAPAS
ncbi:MAG TPA: oxygenase MpaB family protein [Solirubrobacteraceae bacterium]|nr:oxygenase MpaB family protein [Solirubrobacteraceae bacterium]